MGIWKCQKVRTLKIKKIDIKSNQRNMKEWISRFRFDGTK